MHTGIYRIAEHTIEIISVHEQVHMLCQDYRHKGLPDFSVITTQADIDLEQIRSAHEDEAEGIAVRHFSNGYLETLAVYRKIAEAMLEYDTLLFHGSAIAVDGRGYLFTAKSGTGKSTHTRLWREYFGNRAVMVNDDKPLLKVTDRGVTVYGTPWDGKHRLSSNIAVPLEAVCILHRGRGNHIDRLSKAAAWPMLLQQSYRPQDTAGMRKTLELLDRLAESVVLYKLECNMDVEAAITAYEGMRA